MTESCSHNIQNMNVGKGYLIRSKCLKLSIRKKDNKINTGHIRNQKYKAARHYTNLRKLLVELIFLTILGK